MAAFSFVQKAQDSQRRIYRSVQQVVFTPELFAEEENYSVYDDLLAELQRACPPEQKGGLFVSWHGDSHLIADDKRKGGRWKEESPAFRAVIKEMERYFPGFHIQATRFNWYRDDSEWKPYHHDAGQSLSLSL